MTKQVEAGAFALRQRQIAIGNAGIRTWMKSALFALPIAICSIAQSAPLPFEELLYKGKVTAFYGEPKTPVHEQLLEALKRTQLAERMSVIAQATRLKRDLRVGFAACGKPNAFYSPQHSSITFCFEMLELVATLAASDREFAGPTDRKSFAEVIDGVVWGIYLHELGHALIDINRVAITGREEDVADQFALYFAVKFIEPRGARVVLPTVWFFNALGKSRSLTESGDEAVKRLLSDEHSLDQQRTYNFACWALGADPRNGAYAAAYIQLPKERAARCDHEFARLDEGIRTRFKRYFR